VTDLAALLLLVATILFAFFTVEVHDLLHAVLCLCGLCITVGGLFGVLNAPYVMVFQLLVYAGATVALFLFVVMFTRRRDE
jgi:NADH-quinone oxidoreductase subunit J